MKCDNCKIKVGSQFAHSINKNECPGCGKNIMEGAKLASYLSLKALLDNTDGDFDVEKLTNRIMANFEVKQIFKDEVEEEIRPKLANRSVEAEEDTVKDDGPREKTDEEFDQEYKQRQMAEAKAKLQKMREEAYSDALRSQWGMEDGEISVNIDMDIGDDPFGETPEQRALRLKREFELEKQRESILSGAGGFRRSDG